MALYKFPYRILTSGGFEKSRSSLFEEADDDTAAEQRAGEFKVELRKEYPGCDVRISSEPVTEFSA